MYPLIGEEIVDDGNGSFFHGFEEQVRIYAKYAVRQEDVAFVAAGQTQAADKSSWIKPYCL